MTNEQMPSVEQENVQPTQKVPYVLLEVLVYGTEDKKRR